MSIFVIPYIIIPKSRIQKLSVANQNQNKTYSSYWKSKIKHLSLDKKEQVSLFELHVLLKEVPSLSEHIQRELFNRTYPRNDNQLISIKYSSSMERIDKLEKELYGLSNAVSQIVQLLQVSDQVIPFEVIGYLE